MMGFTPGTIAHAVVSAVVDGTAPMQAWRAHLRHKPPRKATLAKIAAALGLDIEQLDCPRWLHRLQLSTLARDAECRNGEMDSC